MPLARLIARPTIACLLSCALLMTAAILLGKTQRGAEIAYISYEPYYTSQALQSPQIHLLDVEKRLSVVLGESASTILWSPDGERLVFACHYEDTLSSEICMLDLSTNEVRRLTQTPDYESPWLWLPNTDQILIFSSSPSLDGAANYLLDLTTGEISTLTFRAPAALVLSWSPDGRYIIYTEPTMGDSYGLFIWDTTLDQLYAEIPFQIYGANSLTWSPDNRHLVFTAIDNRTSTFQLFIASIDEFVPRQISTGGVFNLSPAWSPDGRFIAFSQSLNGCCVEGDLMLVNVVTGEQFLLAHHDAASDYPAWRP
jgi:Tol biopolymer transport system component